MTEEYDRENSGKSGQRECKIMARFRCGNEERENRLLKGSRMCFAERAIEQSGMDVAK
jgi:hypothetical protein